MPTLLVVDDEPAILLAFRRAYRGSGLDVRTAETPDEGLALAAEYHPDVIVLDMQLPGASGLDVFRRLRQQDARTPVVFLTGKSTTETAIEAMKLGAFDYLLKPAELSQLRQVIDRALAVARLAKVPAVVADGEPPDDGADAVVGRCPAMLEVYKAVGRVAGQDVAVLILGESGTGKELVARAVYGHSRRAGKPFLAINCAAIPETLLESELFGHEKGAFTGADRRRVGKFEQCHGGTIFLDEVGDMSPLTQAKILRLLQEGKFERLGGNETQYADVRVIAATNQDLEVLASQGKFRQDLYYRLGVFTVRLPPLRERGDDLPLLARHFVRRFAADMGKEARDLAPEALDLLRQYPWPGNVRELQSVLKQALLRASGPVLLADFLPEVLGRKPAPPAPADAAVSLPQFLEERLAAGSEDLYAEALRRLERLLLTRVLQHTGGNQLQAARLLGITRGSLRNKIRELGITITRTVEEDGAG